MYWYNGQLQDTTTLELDIQEPGLLYGATTFTTLRVYEGNLDHPRSYWKGHRQRLENAVRRFQWKPPDWKRLKTGAQRLGRDYPVLRITLFPNGRELICGRQLPPNLSQRQQEGIIAWIADAPQFRRAIPGSKTGNYLPAWLALQAARQQQAQEAILVSDRGQWLETSTGNLWGWCDGKWWTPPLTAGILPGMAREQICDRALAQNIDIVRQPWSPEFVTGFEALAYTNSVVEVVPIRAVMEGEAEVLCEFDASHPGLVTLRSLLLGDFQKLRDL